MKPHTTVEVTELPSCDFCADAIVPRQRPAYADGKTRFGSWANMCEMHFKQYGCGLGLGKGQKFILKEES